MGLAGLDSESACSEMIVYFYFYVQICQTITLLNNDSCFKQYPSGPPVFPFRRIEPQHPPLMLQQPLLPRELVDPWSWWMCSKCIYFAVSAHGGIRPGCGHWRCYCHCPHPVWCALGLSRLDGPCTGPRTSGGSCGHRVRLPLLLVGAGGDGCRRLVGGVVVVAASLLLGAELLVH